MIAVALAVVLASGGADAGTAVRAAKKPKLTVDPTLRVTERKVCPAKREDVKAGAVCQPTDPETCQFGKSWCACEGTSCVTAAGPIPNCVSTLRWVCRDDGCPRAPRGACSEEGRSCAYDDGLCAREVSCSGGKWVSSGPPQCRPAAPRGPSY